MEIERVPLKDYTLEEMERRGIDPDRVLAGVDISQEHIIEAVNLDPTLTDEQKKRVLETGSPRSPKEIEEAWERLWNKRIAAGLTPDGTGTKFQGLGRYGAPSYSPWGQVQDFVRLADGIVSVSTAGHGGIWLSPERQKEMHGYNDNFLHSAEWWEEDCDWAMPYAFFSREIREQGDAYRFEENLKAAIGTMRHWHPSFIARLKGRVDPGLLQ